MRGRVSKDAELKTFANGGSIVKLVVCTENNYKNKDGEWQKNAEFHSVVVRGSKATAAAGFRKGDMVDVVGRMVTRSFEANGEKRHVTEVATWEVKMAEDEPRSEVNGNREADDFNF